MKMRITRRQLRRLIKEQMRRVLNEASMDDILVRARKDFNNTWEGEEAGQHNITVEIGLEGEEDWRGNMVRPLLVTLSGGDDDVRKAYSGHLENILNMLRDRLRPMARGFNESEINKYREAVESTAEGSDTYTQSIPLEVRSSGTTTHNF